MSRSQAPLCLYTLRDVILTAYNYQQKHVAEVRDAIARAAQAGVGIVGMKAIRVEIGRRRP
jgi:hypothetical protein